MNDNLRGRIALHVPQLDTMARCHRDPVAGESATIIQLLELEVAALELALRLAKECDRCEREQH